eukprot:898417-Rhodomonas_salina.1
MPSEIHGSQAVIERFCDAETGADVWVEKVVGTSAESRLHDSDEEDEEEEAGRDEEGELNPQAEARRTTKKKKHAEETGVKAKVRRSVLLVPEDAWSHAACVQSKKKKGSGGQKEAAAVKGSKHAA